MIPNFLGRKIRAANDVLSSSKEVDNNDYVTQIEVIGTSTVVIEPIRSTSINTLAPYENNIQKMEDEIHDLSEKTKVPPWAIVLSVCIGLIVLMLLVFLIIRKFCKGAFKQGDKISGFKTTMLGHATNAMPLLGETFKEKVQPDVEELTTNVEEEDDDDKDDALYLGKFFHLLPSK